MIEAILFDLDGTLLDVDMDDFLDRYIPKLSAHLADFAEPKSFAKNLWAATSAMVKNTESTVTNEEAFIEHFLTWIDHAPADVLPHIHEFYEEIFPTLQGRARPFPHVQTAIDAAKRFECPIVLATNPIFPLAAIVHRLAWAGLTKEEFTLITSYENMHFCKPNPAYYLEIAEMLKVEPHNCVMIGNDVDFDIRPAAATNMKTFLIADTQKDMDTDNASGPLEDLSIFLDTVHANG
ncbi:MAG: HAD family hydrolase [Firmicutes bacterium]|nr:HAD family hydrolase [Bacillota bacterium]